MRYECTRWGVLIDEKYLSAREALSLLQWLIEQQESLRYISQQELPAPVEPPQQRWWSEEEEQEMLSEDEQIANF